MPRGTDCMCAVCLTSSPPVEHAIAASKAPQPCEPEHLDPPREGWWTCEPTVYEPDPGGRAGGTGAKTATPALTRKQRRAALKGG